jgi:hypothetical protein
MYRRKEIKFSSFSLRFMALKAGRLENKTQICAMMMRKMATEEKKMF